MHQHFLFILKRECCNLALLWSVEDVCHWLHCLDLDEYQGVFVSRDIQGRELISLSLGDLKVGHSRS